MFTAILIACLISAPADCRRHEILIQTAMPTQAWIEANYRAAEWLQAHPDMRKDSLKVLPGRGA